MHDVKCIDSFCFASSTFSSSFFTKCNFCVVFNITDDAFFTSHSRVRAQTVYFYFIIVVGFFFFVISSRFVKFNLQNDGTYSCLRWRAFCSLACVFDCFFLLFLKTHHASSLTRRMNLGTTATVSSLLTTRQSMKKRWDEADKSDWMRKTERKDRIAWITLIQNGCRWSRLLTISVYFSRLCFDAELVSDADIIQWHNSKTYLLGPYDCICASTRFSVRRQRTKPFDSVKCVLRCIHTSAETVTFVFNRVDQCVAFTFFFLPRCTIASNVFAERETYLCFRSTSRY